jgi:hypothetical protein
MFEAHYYSPDNAHPPSDTHTANTDQFTFSQIVTHPLYDCPVYVWGSTGKREGRATLFGYLEYRTLLGGRSEYHEVLIEKASPKACIDALLTRELPGIDIEATRNWAKETL